MSLAGINGWWDLSVIQAQLVLEAVQPLFWGIYPFFQACRPPTTLNPVWGGEGRSTKAFLSC